MGGLQPKEESNAADEQTVKSGSLSVFVLIDALGWEFLKGRHFLDDLLPHRQSLRTVLGFSSGAIPSILTGVPPSQNGHWNLFYYDPQHSPFGWFRHFGFLPDRVLDNRVTRKLLKEMGRRFLGLGKTFECKVSPRLLPWFNFAEKRSIYESGGITGAKSIFDELADAGTPYHVYTYHEGSDKELMETAKRDIQENKASFVFLYLSEMDAALHDHCKESEVLDRRLAWYAQGLRDLLGTVYNQDPRAMVCVFSDHGMTPVQHHYNVVRDIEACGFSMPDDYLAIYDSTMARFWFRSDAARKAIPKALTNLPCGRILPEEELRQLGVLFPDGRYGEVIFLLHPGWLISESDFNGRGWMPSGMHGYHPNDPYSDAAFLSNQQPRAEMQSIADVHQVMREAAGLPEARGSSVFPE